MFGKNLTSSSSKNKIFRGLRLFEYALWEETKTQKRWKLTESFLNQKEPSVNELLLLENCQKLINLLPIIINQLIQFLDFITRKAAFEVSMINAHG